MTFNQQLIVGLWKIRNRNEREDLRQGTRNWLRQCVNLERERRSL